MTNPSQTFLTHGNSITKHFVMIIETGLATIILWKELQRFLGEKLLKIIGSLKILRVIFHQKSSILFLKIFRGYAWHHKSWNQKSLEQHSLVMDPVLLVVNVTHSALLIEPEKSLFQGGILSFVADCVIGRVFRCCNTFWSCFRFFKLLKNPMKFQTLLPISYLSQRMTNRK